MNELTLKIDDWFNKELEDYLFSLKGISKTIVDCNQNEIYIKYDSKIIGIGILEKEISLFLSNLNIPSIVAFNKHSKKETIAYSITIKDLCCEYCLKNMIEELILINGIERAFSNFDYNNKKNVLINIEYDNNLINEKELLSLENKFNSKI